MGMFERLAERPVRLGVGTLQRAVPADVGVDKPPHATALHVDCHVDGVEAAAFRPSSHTNLAVSRIDPNDDTAAGKARDGLINHIGIAHRARTQNHAVYAMIEKRLDVLDRAHATANLNRDVKRLRDVLNHPAVVDRKSTRLNSSHVAISYAVFCLKKKKNTGKENV